MDRDAYGDDASASSNLVGMGAKGVLPYGLGSARAATGALGS